MRGVQQSAIASRNARRAPPVQPNSTGPALAQTVATPTNPQGAAGDRRDDYDRMDIDNGINDDDEVRERFRLHFLPSINLKHFLQDSFT